MCGKAWPMIFGTTQDCPATQITRVCQAVTVTPVGILSMPITVLPMYANGLNSDLAAYQTMAIDSVKISLLQCCSVCWAQWEASVSPNGLSGETIVNNCAGDNDPADNPRRRQHVGSRSNDERPVSRGESAGHEPAILKSGQRSRCQDRGPAKDDQGQGIVHYALRASRRRTTRRPTSGAPMQTLGGEDFPQNTPIWINIGGGFVLRLLRGQSSSTLPTA